jgi:hypothetical protein
MAGLLAALANIPAWPTPHIKLVRLSPVAIRLTFEPAQTDTGATTGVGEVFTVSVAEALLVQLEVLVAVTLTLYPPAAFAPVRVTWFVVLVKTPLLPQLYVEPPAAVRVMGWPAHVSGLLGEILTTGRGLIRIVVVPVFEQLFVAVNDSVTVAVMLKLVVLSPKVSVLLAVGWAPVLPNTPFVGLSMLHS